MVNDVVCFFTGYLTGLKEGQVTDWNGNMCLRKLRVLKELQ